MPKEKLVRDKVVEFIESEGRTVIWRQATLAEFPNLLRAKFIEETKEIFNAPDRKNLVEELADLFELILVQGETQGISLEEIIQMADKKRQLRGSFKMAIVLNKG